MAYNAVVGTVTYAELSTAVGKYLLDYNTEGPEREAYSFHTPGVNGNYVVLGGFVGTTINLLVRYVDTNVIATANTDFETFAQDTAGLTVTVDGTAFSRCRVLFAKTVTPVRPCQVTAVTYQFRDYQLVIKSDGNPF